MLFQKRVMRTKFDIYVFLLLSFTTEHSTENSWSGNTIPTEKQVFFLEYIPSILKYICYDIDGPVIKVVDFWPQDKHHYMWIHTPIHISNDKIFTHRPMPWSFTGQFDVLIWVLFLHQVR